MLRVVLVVVLISKASCSYPSNIPDVWGGIAEAPPGGVLHDCSGQLFGFSGLDGVTSESTDFVGIFQKQPYNLRFCGLSHQRILTVTPPSSATPAVLVATNDVFVADTGSTPVGTDGRVKLAWASGSQLVGEIPPDSGVWLSDSQPSAQGCNVSQSADDAVALCSSPTPLSMRFGLAYGKTSADAVASAQASMTPSLDDVITSRLGQYNHTPTVQSLQKLLHKAISVMRVNALSPEGGIKQRWSTPDRVPHQWMWLWDSCYHSMAINQLQLWNGSAAVPGHTAGWEYIQSVMDAAAPDGAIAIERTPSSVGTNVTQTQPPLLAWGTWENFIAANSSSPEEAIARLQYAFPRLAGYLQWDLEHRTDPTGRTPLLVWTQGTESGMDNSQRFDNRTVPDMLSVDFSVFLAREARFLSQIAAQLGNSTAAKHWMGISSNVSAWIHRELWDERSGFYYDKDVHTGFSSVKAVSGFLPLWLSDIPAARVQRMVAMMRDPEKFGSPVPLPSVSLDTAGFSTDMWRGPMWINTNYMVAEALAARGEQQQAVWLLRASLDCVQKYYDKYGVLFEFYDAQDVHDPRTLLRKGARSGGIRDYHWSAALTLRMIMAFDKMTSTL